MTVLGQWITALQSFPLLQASFLAACATIVVAVIQDYKTLAISNWLASVSTLGALSIWAAAGYAVGGVEVAASVTIFGMFVILAVFMVGGLSQAWMGFGFDDVKIMVPLSLFFPALSFQSLNPLRSFDPYFASIVSPITFVLNTILIFIVFLAGLHIYCRIKKINKLVPLTPVMTASFIGTALFGAFWWGGCVFPLVFLLPVSDFREITLPSLSWIQGVF